MKSSAPYEAKSLRLARVDANDAQADGCRVLHSEVTEATTGARDDDKVAWLRVGLLDGLPDRDAGAEDWRSDLHGEALGDGRDVLGVGHGVLLERAVDRVPTQLCVRARGLLTSQASLAVETAIGKPLQAHGAANLELAGLDDLVRVVDADGPVALVKDDGLGSLGDVGHDTLVAGKRQTKCLAVTVRLLLSLKKSE